uniref:Uncharacterized protein n=1 Tax=Haptolina brevifila TaxID=156173 RepID=A0A7S2H0U0_9EUKA|mmetsp:Transcript_49925/g.99388  ORF Transcript_49925/g.99388 Transcript_49925/m.99388 type:complete len:472 (+) Transcript_49925:119-1534(+)|eukprot:CAMPEP_0174729164 /NCGR_PEP_ID=MMETSP1094-20130205/53179_1 /TAXON_ID=156173 /ORGANISM="Chrysochromulina brevifilum, Strain UTEX LB 985" /LENGTH=471 /DNA_ID=CAMNT_0015931227 /DNA_START=61 /DNA_END=1476 /DNA_ORIENTATION=+
MTAVEAAEASIHDMVAELERNRNKQDDMLINAQSAGGHLTTKMRNKLKRLQEREKELEKHIKASQKSGIFKKLGDELRKAVTNNDLDKVTQMCSAPGCPLDSANFEGTTALIKAAIHNRVAIVDMLLTAGAEVNLSDDRQRSALMLAAANGAVASISSLVANGADCSAVAHNGYNAFMFAAEGGHLEACRLLYSSGGAELSLLTTAPNGKTARDLVPATEDGKHSALVSFIEEKLAEQKRANIVVDAAMRSADGGEGTADELPGAGWRKLRRLSKVTTAASAFDQGILQANGNRRPREEEEKLSFANVLRHSSMIAFNWMRGIAEPPPPQAAAEDRGRVASTVTVGGAKGSAAKGESDSFLVSTARLLMRKSAPEARGESRGEAEGESETTPATDVSLLSSLARSFKRRSAPAPRDHEEEDEAADAADGGSRSLLSSLTKSFKRSKPRQAPTSSRVLGAASSRPLAAPTVV